MLDAASAFSSPVFVQEIQKYVSLKSQVHAKEFFHFGFLLLKECIASDHAP
jgi:hypothetical protein